MKQKVRLPHGEALLRLERVHGVDTKEELIETLSHQTINGVTEDEYFREQWGTDGGNYAD